MRASESREEVELEADAEEDEEVAEEMRTRRRGTQEAHC